MILVVIEWRANQPRWVQIAAVIKQRIDGGVYAVDEQVPSEHQIVQEFGVAAARPAKSWCGYAKKGSSTPFGGWATSWRTRPQIINDDGVPLVRLHFTITSCDRLIPQSVACNLHDHKNFA